MGGAVWSRMILATSASGPSAEIVGGVALSRWYPELPNATLWCTTEVITKQQIDDAASVIAAAPVEA